MRLVITLALFAFTLLGASAIAAPEIGQKDNGFSIADERYLNLYERAHDAGFDVGANLLASNWSDAAPVSDARIAESTAVLERWLNPPEPEPVAEPTTTETATSSYTAPAPAPVASDSGGGCPSSMYAESGSAGYSAYNPSSGATGCYQIIPSTAAAHGCDLSTPGGQDACAAEICATQGSGAWAASGANPC